MTYYIAQHKGDTANDDNIAIAKSMVELRNKLENLHLPTHEGIEILQTRDCKILSRFDLV